MLQCLDPALSLSGHGESTHFSCQGLVNKNKHKGSAFLIKHSNLSSRRAAVPPAALLGCRGSFWNDGHSVKSGHIDFLPSGPTWPWLLCCNDDNDSALILTCSTSVQTQLFSLQRALPTSVLCCWDPGHQSRPLYPRGLLPASVFLLRPFFYCKRWHSTSVNNTNPEQAAWLWILNEYHLLAV